MQPLLRDVSTLPVRAVLGSTMLYHGAAKLKPGAPEQTAQFFESVGIKPGKPMALLSGIAEVASGALVLSGLGTRLGALLTLVTQSVAIAKVHRSKGFDNTKGGFEFNLLLIAVAAGLLIAGPGRYSGHELLEHRVKRSGRRLLRPSRQSQLLRLIKLIK